MIIELILTLGVWVVYVAALMTTSMVIPWLHMLLLALGLLAITAVMANTLLSLYREKKTSQGFPALGRGKCSGSAGQDGISRRIPDRP